MQANHLKQISIVSAGVGGFQESLWVLLNKQLICTAEVNADYLTLIITENS